LRRRPRASEAASATQGDERLQVVPRKEGAGQDKDLVQDGVPETVGVLPRLGVHPPRHVAAVDLVVGRDPGLDLAPRIRARRVDADAGHDAVAREGDGELEVRAVKRARVE
jgi:hypothetical protein